MTIHGDFNEDDIADFIKQIIDQVKIDLNSRLTLFTLNLDIYLIILNERVPIK